MARLICLFTVLFICAAMPVRAQELAHAYLEGDVSWPGPEITYDGEPFEMRWATGFPPSSAMIPMMHKAGRMLERITRGKIRVKHYHAGQLIARPETFRAMRRGIAEFAACYSSLEKSMIASHITEMPFVIRGNPAQATRVWQEIAAKYLKPEYERYRIYMGGPIQTGGLNLMANDPIRSLEDLENKKIAVINRTNADIIEALGGVPVNIGFADLYTAMQRGTVDGILWLDAAFIPLKFYEVAQYRTVVNVAASTNDHCISREFYDSLPSDLKDHFSRWVQFFIQAAAQIVAMESVDWQAYDRAGVETITLSGSERERWIAQTKPLRDRWIRQASEEGFPARRMMADIKELSDQYEDYGLDELIRLTIEQPVDQLARP